MRQQVSVTSEDSAGRTRAATLRRSARPGETWTLETAAGPGVDGLQAGNFMQLQDGGTVDTEGRYLLKEDPRS